VTPRPSPVAAWLKAAFFENFSLKLVSLLVAIGLFAFFRGAQNFQRTVTVSVVALMPPDSVPRELMNPLPTEVRLSIRGSKNQLDVIRSDDLGPIQIDLRSGQVSHVELEPSMFNVPPGLQVEGIDPPAIDLRWDDIIDRVVPIEVSRVGATAPGLVQKGALVADPSEVKVRGPKSLVEGLKVRAAVFDVSGLLEEGTHKRTLDLDKPPPRCTFDVASVVGQLEIAREMKKKEFGAVRIEVVGMPKAKTVPGVVNVTIEGTPEEVDGITQDLILPRVEPKTAGLDTATSPGSAMIDVQVDLAKVKLKVEPKRVLLKW